MSGEAPPFWWRKPGWQAAVLWPASFLYGRVAGWRMDMARPPYAPLPVLCVGNFTVGGSGKTPVAIAMARAALAAGRKPGFLSRGHGGSHARPHLVDPAHDTARHVGDEPLLLAAHAPVAVTRDRKAGAALLRETGCDFLIMDDGFQSRRIHFDYSLLVVDSRRGLGNGHIIPGGPVRAPVVTQLRQASALLVIGDGDAASRLVRVAARAARPVFHAHVQPREAVRFAGRKFVAFAGIGEPEKFYDTVEACAGYVAASRNFADHHFYTDDDLQELQALAASNGARLITTAKDAARLTGGTPLAKAFREQIEVLEVETVFDSPDAPARIIRQTLEAFRARRDRGQS